ncbi:hypothetical protein PF003_g9841 [Phytophthora fragariae]|nr:hypothetical protein PF003_g9841 [Phytophthora fragariae]
MESLKELCSQRLAKLARIENVAVILQAATEHNDASLREDCFSFMLGNLEAAQLTQSFKDMAFKNPKIMLEVLEKVTPLVQIV